MDDGPDWSHQANAGEESGRAATVATGLTCASGHDAGAVVFCGNLIEANVSLESKQCIAMMDRRDSRLTYDSSLFGGRDS